MVSYSKRSSARQRTREIGSTVLPGELVSKYRVTRLGGACSPLGRNTWPRELNFYMDKSAVTTKCQSCSGPGKSNCNKIVWICSLSPKCFCPTVSSKPRHATGAATTEVQRIPLAPQGTEFQGNYLQVLQKLLTHILSYSPPRKVRLLTSPTL